MHPYEHNELEPEPDTIISEDPPVIPLYTDNDKGNAQRFLDAQGDNVRYSAPEKLWYFFNDSCWKADHEKQIERMADAALDASYQREVDYFEWLQDTGIKLEQLIKRSRKQWKNAGNVQTLNNCLNMAAIQSAISPSVFDRDPHLFHTPSGTIDLMQTTVLEPDRSHYITKTAGAEFARGADCPAWKHFVLQCCEGDWELYRYLQKIAGYSVLSGKIDEQKVFCLYGPGRNGKSLFINTLARIAGDYACKIDASIISLTKRGDKDNDVAKELYRMRGSRFVYTSEFNKNTVLNEAFIKAITDGGHVSCRPMYNACMEYMPTYTLWFSTNNAPQLQGMDDGIKRRFVLIPFLHKVSEEEMDKTLADTFEAEASGILNWLLRGYLNYQSEGLPAPQIVQQATSNYISEQNLFAMFVDEHYSIDPNGKTYASDIYETYKQWCKENGLQAESMHILGRELQQLGASRGKDRTGRYYMMKPQTDTENIQSLSV